MKNSMMLLMMVLVMLFGCSSTQQTTTPVVVNPIVYVRGQVVDAKTNKAIFGARIEVAGYFQVTDELGQFPYIRLPQGNQTFIVTAGGYDELRQTLTFDRGGGTSVLFKMNPVAVVPPIVEPELVEVFYSVASGASTPAWDEKVFVANLNPAERDSIKNSDGATASPDGEYVIIVRPAHNVKGTIDISETYFFYRTLPFVTSKLVKRGTMATLEFSPDAGCEFDPVIMTIYRKDVGVIKKTIDGTPARAEIK